MPFDIYNALTAAPLALLGFSALHFQSTPKGYATLDADHESLGALWKLTIISRSLATVGAALSLASVYFNADQYWLWILVLVWLGLLMLAPRLHAPNNVANGSHLAMVLVAGMNAIAISWLHQAALLRLHWPESLNNLPMLLAPLQIVLSIAMFFIVGSWSSKTYDPTSKASRETGASVFAQLSFTWLTPLIQMGSEKSLDQENVWFLISDDNSKTVIDRFAQIPGTYLPWSLFRFIMPLLIFQWTCALCSTILSFAGPFFLYNIVNVVAVTKGQDKLVPILYLAMLYMCTCLKSIIDGQMFFTGRRTGNRLRSILVDLLYQKSLKRASSVGSAEPDSKAQASLGKIVTLMSVDAEFIRTFVSYCHEWLIIQPVSIVVALVGLWYILQWSSLAGVAMMLLLIPVGSYLGKLITVYQLALMKSTDTRVNLMNELLQGIRIIKYFSWESHFSKLITNARTAELTNLFRFWLADMGFTNIGNGTSIIVGFVTFSTYTLVFQHNLSAEIAFTAINLLNIVNGLLSYLPMNVMKFVKAYVAMSRINDFLSEIELEQYSAIESDGGDDEWKQENSARRSSNDTVIDSVVGFTNASFSYFGSSCSAPEDLNQPQIRGTDFFSLDGLDVSFPIGGLSLVIGPTGAGKSSILLALLGGNFK